LADADCSDPTRGNLSRAFMMPDILNFHLPPTSSSAMFWVSMSTENEVRIGGIKSDNLCGDVHLSQVYDEDIGCDMGER